MKRLTLRPVQIIVISFAALILAGAMALMLPWASRDGQGVGFPDALFTAVSAVCVTGLVVRDTARCWSGFGQAVILLLIQLGGLGMVTATGAMLAIIGRPASLRQRAAVRDSLSSQALTGILPLARRAVGITLFAELLGALAMAPVFCGRFGLGMGLWYSLFHAVSAFCNAGFDLMGICGAYSSLTAFASDPVINLVICALIVTGGLGFATWADIRTHGVHLHRYTLQSKMILTATAILILVPGLYLYFAEFAVLPGRERLLASLFQSVTPRTAGFNTVDLNGLRGPGKALIICLMLIGGSPGSTAGGMKTTTAAVLLATVWAEFLRRDQTQLMGRRLDNAAVRTAASVLTVYLLLFLTGGAAISLIEDLPLGVCLFESASALGTVGLSLGITPSLGAVSRWILMFLMFYGRAGGLTLFFAAIAGGRKVSMLPMEKITVG